MKHYYLMYKNIHENKLFKLYKIMYSAICSFFYCLFEIKFLELYKENHLGILRLVDIRI